MTSYFLQSTRMTMADDAQVNTIVWVVTVNHHHHPKCNELQHQQMLDPALQQYFRSLIEGGMSPTQALGVYEESLMGDTQGKLQFNREIKVQPLSSNPKHQPFTMSLCSLTPSNTIFCACSEVEETSPYRTRSHPYPVRYCPNWT
jgi:hypothetical protein